MDGFLGNLEENLMWNKWIKRSMTFVLIHFHVIGISISYDQVFKIIMCSNYMYTLIMCLRRLWLLRGPYVLLMAVLRNLIEEKWQVKAFQWCLICPSSQKLSFFTQNSIVLHLSVCFFVHTWMEWKLMVGPIDRWVWPQGIIVSRCQCLTERNGFLSTSCQGNNPISFGSIVEHSDNKARNHFAPNLLECPNHRS